MKALKAGKHVLLEKPSTSNALEARSLFRNPLLARSQEVSLQTGGNPLVLLEAVHIRFHPAWQKFLSFIDSSEVAEATSTHHLPKGSLPTDDIRFQYNLSSGCLMDFGSYNIQHLRQVFGTEPSECVTASVRRMPAGLDPNIDQAFSAIWKFWRHWKHHLGFCRNWGPLSACANRRSAGIQGSNVLGQTSRESCPASKNARNGSGHYENRHYVEFHFCIDLASNRHHQGSCPPAYRRWAYRKTVDGEVVYQAIRWRLRRCLLDHLPASA